MPVAGRQCRLSSAGVGEEGRKKKPEAKEEAGELKGGKAAARWKQGAVYSKGRGRGQWSVGGALTS